MNRSLILVSIVLASGCARLPSTVNQASSVTTGGTTGAGTGPATLAIAPPRVLVTVGGSVTFSGQGGYPPYTFSSSGGETIGTNGLYASGTGQGGRTITLRDQSGATATAQLTIVVPAADTPNDALLPSQPDLTGSLETPDAWGITTNCSAMVVAVIDTGIDMKHPDLAANIWTNPKPTMNDPHGWNFVDGNNDATDQNFHGTHVAGTIGAQGNNARGVTGICWTASLVPVRFLDENGAGDVTDAVDALNYAVDTLGAKILNASWGIAGQSQVLSDAIQHASNAGALLIAAAGNGDANNNGLDIDLPANFTAPANYTFPGVIPVAAVDNTDTLASFSNYGTNTVVIAAPGVGIMSTFPSFQTLYAQQNNVTLTPYETLDGTSMATPHVTGAIALTWSYYPTWTAAQVKARLLGQADPISGLQGKVAAGARLNIYHMLVDH